MAVAEPIPRARNDIELHIGAHRPTPAHVDQHRPSLPQPSTHAPSVGLSDLVPWCDDHDVDRAHERSER